VLTHDEGTCDEGEDAEEDGDHRLGIDSTRSTRTRGPRSAWVCSVSKP
jgi:hypothetical protein